MYRREVEFNLGRYLRDDEFVDRLKRLTGMDILVIDYQHSRRREYPLDKEAIRWRPPSATATHSRIIFESEEPIPDRDVRNLKRILLRN